MSTRILIVDDHTLVRHGIVALVSDMADCEVVGQASSAAEALDMAMDLRPDLVLLDIHMPEQTGLDVLPQLRAALPQTKVLMLSMFSDTEHVKTALDRGANGYLLKDATHDDIELAIRSATRGHLWMSAQIGVGKTELGLGGGEEALLEQLTQRQLEVLKRLVEGAGTKEIGFELGLSGKTIETYRQQIQDRLGVHDLPGLVKLAIRGGLIRL